MDSKIKDKLLISEVLRFPAKKYEWQMRFIYPKIYLFDVEIGKVIRHLNTPPAWFDPGEYRFLKKCYHYNGARGITESDRLVYVALQNRIVAYDKKLTAIVKIIDHPLLNGIHEIEYYNGKLYITCAVTDSIAVCDGEGLMFEFITLGDNPGLINHYNLRARTLDNRLDYRVMHKIDRLFHVNNIQKVGEALYINLNRQGAFAKIQPEFELFVSRPEMVNSHNGCISPDKTRILINDTNHFSLKVFTIEGMLIDNFDFREYRLPIDFSQNTRFKGDHYIRAGWLRGLAFSNSDPDVVFLGLSPSTVVWINYRNGKLLGFHQFRKSIWASIHGIHVLESQEIFQ